MNVRLIAACALLLAIGAPASAHRLDEYLQATTISLTKDRVQGFMRLTPGVKVFSNVFASVDTDRNGVLSEAEQRAYAERVLGDLSLAADGARLPLRLTSWKFGPTSEMKEGRGDIQIEFEAAAPDHGSNRNLIFENHHQSKISVYLINCLVPSDPNIQVTGQNRDFLQSHYELDYTQAGALVSTAPVIHRSGIPIWIYSSALLLFLPLAWIWRRTKSGSGSL